MEAGVYYIHMDDKMLMFAKSESKLHVKYSKWLKSQGR